MLTFIIYHYFAKDVLAALVATLLGAPLLVLLSDGADDGGVSSISRDESIARMGSAAARAYAIGVGDAVVRDDAEVHQPAVGATHRRQRGLAELGAGGAHGTRDGVTTAGRGFG